VKKTDTNDVNTFSTLNYPPVGIFTPQQTYRAYEQAYTLSLDTIIHRKVNTLIAQQPEHIATTLETDIGHIMLTPSTDSSILDWYREK
jgi:L-asparaginase/Glu-tRNA(Gln) amidotransferase subunit D